MESVDFRRNPRPSCERRTHKQERPTCCGGWWPGVHQVEHIQHHEAVAACGRKLWQEHGQRHARLVIGFGLGSTLPPVSKSCAFQYSGHHERPIFPNVGGNPLNLDYVSDEVHRSLFCWLDCSCHQLIGWFFGFLVLGFPKKHEMR